MNGERKGRAARAACCAALLALLAASGYAGVKEAPSVSVAVTRGMISEEALTAASMEDTKKTLQSRRQEALNLLDEVIGDPKTDDQTAEDALHEKIQIARRIDMEAGTEAALRQMGMGETIVVLSEETAALIVPWQAAENEQNRLRMIDTAAALTGLEAGRIKIILAKK